MKIADADVKTVYRRCVLPLVEPFAAPGMSKDCYLGSR
jgi:hypothetical protein